MKTVKSGTAIIAEPKQTVQKGEPMSDLISRADAILQTCADKCGCEPEECGLTFERDGTESCSDVRLLMELPSVQPERKTGHWIPQDDNKRTAYATTAMYYFPNCSECGHAGSLDMNFCPNCGADMRGEQE